ncbi:MAG: rhodanese-like domain-containing protein [Turicibacter sanguinis]|uniref:rhodanese-like domain-containing protein n=1 Tax=Turicibacter sanguinis TaxID=154288 RepID=UPI0039939C92
MRKAIGKLLFCLVFIFLMTVAILDYESTQSAALMQQTSPQIIQRESAEELMDNTKEILIIDVRDADEYEKGHIRNAINIPYNQLEQHLDELMAYQDTPIIIYCQSGNCSKIAGEKLEELGFTKVYVIEDKMD